MNEEYEIEPQKTKTGSYTAECPVCARKEKLFYAMATTRQGVMTALLTHMNERHEGKNH